MNVYISYDPHSSEERAKLCLDYVLKSVVSGVLQVYKLNDMGVIPNDLIESLYHQIVLSQGISFSSPDDFKIKPSKKLIVIEILRKVIADLETLRSVTNSKRNAKDFERKIDKVSRMRDFLSRQGEGDK